MIGRSGEEFRPTFLGNILLVLPNNGQLMEITGKDHKTLWTMPNLLNPWDAQWLGKDRLLVAEYNGRRVTERNLKGESLWEAKVPFPPMQVERLRSGETVIVGNQQIMVVDRTGRQTALITRNEGIRTARKLPNGQFMVLNNRNELIRMDKEGKEISKVRIPQVVYQQNEILDNGNVLVALGGNNRVVEYSSEGKEVWSMNTEQQPMHVIRLPNRHVLVLTAAGPYKVIEYDQTGRKIREYVTNQYLHRIRSR
jgi:hypothetical protein